VQRVQHCAEALGLIDEQLAQEESIGKVYLLHGETIAAGEHFEGALSLTNDRGIRARLLCEAASSLVAAGDKRGVEYIREALAVLNSNPVLWKRPTRSQLKRDFTTWQGVI